MWVNLVVYCRKKCASFLVSHLRFWFIVILLLGISSVLGPREKVGTVGVAPNAMIFKEIVRVAGKGERGVVLCLIVTGPQCAESWPLREGGREREREPQMCLIKDTYRSKAKSQFTSLSLSVSERASNHDITRDHFWGLHSECNSP